MSGETTFTLNLGSSSGPAGTSPTLVFGRFVRGSEATVYVARVLANAVNSPTLKIEYSGLPGTPVDNVLCADTTQGDQSNSSALFLMVPTGVANTIVEYTPMVPWIYKPAGVDVGTMSLKLRVTDFNNQPVTYTDLVLQCHCVYSNTLPRLPVFAQHQKELHITNGYGILH